MPGPEEARLIQALQGAHPGKAGGGANDWESCAGLLERVALALSIARMPIEPGDAGGQTATAITASFHRSAEAMTTRAGKMRNGNTALADASQVITEANDAHVALGPEPGMPTYTPHENPNSAAGIKKHNAFLGDMAAYDAKREHREKVAKHHADKMDTVFAKSSATMKEIHGIPDPPPPPQGYSGNGSGGGGGHSTPAHHSSTSPSTSGGGTTTTLDPFNPGHGGGGHGGHGNGNGGGTIGDGTGGDGGSSEGSVPTGPGPGIGDPPTTLPGSPSGGTSSGTGLGLAGAAAGGIGGGVLGTGLATGGIRGGGIAPISTGGGTASSGVRGIGATSRSGVSGTLGRSGGVTTGSSTGTTSRGAGARSSGVAGRGAGSRGSGSRGAAGGRGTAAGGGRGGRSKDDEKKKGRQGEFDDTEDWIDDEDIAPSVLD